MNFVLQSSKKRQKVVVSTLTTLDEGQDDLFKKTDFSDLIIPLKPIREEQSSNQESFIDSKAVFELLAEAKVDHGSSNETSMTIESQMIQEKTDVTSKKRMPLLRAFLAQELEGVTDDDTRFKIDISLRPENLNVKSAVYQEIPVACFGEALLKGMGWKGLTMEDEEHAKKIGDVHSRVTRLGLGAVANPEAARNLGKAKQAEITQEWEKMAKSKLATQIIRDGDVVWMRSPMYVGRRGQVEQTNGVPGLAKIRVRLETDGALIEVKKTDVLVLSASELEDVPFRPVHISLPITLYNGGEEKEFVDDWGKADLKRKVEELSRTSEARSSTQQLSSQASHEATSKRDHAHGVSEPSWVLPGIRVRVVSKTACGPTSYLQKGWLIDVIRDGQASVQLDSGRIVEAKEKHLETVLPSVGGNCLVLRGSERGRVARLLEKDRAAEAAVIQFEDDLSVCKISMDDIAAHSRSAE